LTQDEIVEQQVNDLFGRSPSASLPPSSPPRRLSSDLASYIDFSVLSGLWYTHYLRGMGHKLSSYRDCISLNLTVTDDGLITIKDKRRIGKSSNFVLIEETYQCEIDPKLTNVTMARDKKMSVLSC
jgi:hypothetical protein